MIEKQAVDDSRSQVLDACLVDLSGEVGTLRVRLIHASICDRLIVSPLDFCI